MLTLAHCQSFGSRVWTTAHMWKPRRIVFHFYRYCLFWRKSSPGGWGVMDRHPLGPGTCPVPPWGRKLASVLSGAPVVMVCTDRTLGVSCFQIRSINFSLQTILWKMTQPKIQKRNSCGGVSEEKRILFSLHSLNCRTSSSTDTCLIVIAEQNLMTIKKDVCDLYLFLGSV